MCNADRIKLLNMQVDVYHSKYEYVITFYTQFSPAKFNRFEPVLNRQYEPA